MSIYPDRARSRVLLIGTSRYERPDQLSDLPAVRNNLFDLTEALTGLPTSTFDRKYCSIVDNPDSPKTMMRHLLRNSKEADHVLLVYFAGHGILGWGGQLHLSVYETDTDQIAGTAVPFEWVRQAMEESPALIRILILDCCFSGRAIGAMSSDSAALEQIAVSGTYIITSTTATRVSRSVPGERHTAFTHELINLLQYGASTLEDPLTVSELYRPLTVSLARRGLPTPKCSMSDVSGELILRRPIVQKPSGPAHQQSSPSTSVDTISPITTSAVAGQTKLQVPIVNGTTRRSGRDKHVNIFYTIVLILASILFSVTVITALSLQPENARANGEEIAATFTICIALIAVTYGLAVYRTKRDIFWRPRSKSAQSTVPPEGVRDNKLAVFVRALWIVLLSLTSLTLLGTVLVGLFYTFGGIYHGDELVVNIITTALFGATLYGCLFLLIRALQRP